MGERVANSHKPHLQKPNDLDLHCFQEEGGGHNLSLWILLYLFINSVSYNLFHFLYIIIVYPL